MLNVLIEAPEMMESASKGAMIPIFSLERLYLLGKDNIDHKLPKIKNLPLITSVDSPQNTLSIQ